jgi:hypothetical protein
MSRRIRHRRASTSLRTAFIAACSIVVIYSGCTSNQETETTETTTTTVTGTGAGGPCFNNLPDNLCIANGPNEEGCDCSDCEPLAKCTGGCSDDGTCDANEDCSCNDCYQLVPNCSPEDFGCDNEDEGVCQPGESCTCPDCTNTPACGGENCSDNGVCNPIFEGCSCADCAGQCGSGPGPGAGGGPGSGGAPAGSGGFGGAPPMGGFGGIGGN